MNAENALPDAAAMETVQTASTPGCAKAHPVSRAFDAFSSTVTRRAGSSFGFGLAVIPVAAVWLASGPVFKFFKGRQLVINTGTTIVTLLMVCPFSRVPTRTASQLGWTERRWRSHRGTGGVPDRDSTTGGAAGARAASA